MESSDKGLFIKIMDQKRVESFLDGQVYFNTDKFFTQIDKNDIVRFDPNENIDESLQVKEVAIQNPENGEYLPIGGLINPVKVRYESKTTLNIFCIYIHLEKNASHFDERNLSFGQSAVIINDPVQFTKRIHNAANKMLLNVEQRPIEYVDPKEYHGTIGPFRKYDNFKYQNEFRYLLYPGQDKPITLEIGDLRDICVVINTKEITNCALLLTKKA
ncbi:hypothetical protein [Marinomonas colpomeniae]|uniref:Uncharacterized protein n=1 Tax=Marinomonas colpomeniae TaxID=2774408 RepID=A0ABR8P342_9GAMM|nr:hypothetical protein [Marinomonas colpomeniae]MBD5772709.1 hypothetical protein [Marinomonas colpomeniae]